MEPDLPSRARRENARILSAAIEGGLWANSSWKNRIGMVLLWSGSSVLGFVLFGERPIGWLTFGLALLAAAAGAVLLFVGARFFHKSMVPAEQLVNDGVTLRSSRSMNAGAKAIHAFGTSPMVAGSVRR